VVVARREDEGLAHSHATFAERKGTYGGCEKPGAFTNRVATRGAGGAVVLPGGFSTAAGSAGLLQTLAGALALRVVAFGKNLMGRAF